MDENQVDSVDLSADNGLNAEKTFTQSELNKIVQHRAAKAADTARRQAQEEFQRDSQNSAHSSAAPIDENAVYQKVVERLNAESQAFEKQREQEQINNYVDTAYNSYLSKVKRGADSYDDFHETTKLYDPKAYPHLTILMSETENPEDILYEMMKNPQKLVELDGHARTNPNLARHRLSQISTSITQNKDAKANAESQGISAPLDRLQPSRISGSSDKMSVQDYMNQPWNRG